MAETKTDPKAKKSYSLGTGRRKTSVARVRMCEGSGKISINGRDLDNYFTEEKDRRAVLGPLDACEVTGRVDLIIRVQGGGFTGQGGAICQGVARAIKVMFGLAEAPAPAAPATTLAVPGAAATAPAEPGAEPPGGGMAKKLRDSGFLTRDGRMKERKKYGRKGARKSFQFSKR